MKVKSLSDYTSCGVTGADGFFRSLDLGRNDIGGGGGLFKHRRRKRRGKGKNTTGRVIKS